METEIIFQAIQEIRDSIITINGEVGAAQIDIAVLKTQMAELIWWFRLIVGGFFVWFVTQLGKVVLWIKNNRKKL